MIADALVVADTLGSEDGGETEGNGASLCEVGLSAGRVAELGAEGGAELGAKGAELCDVVSEVTGGITPVGVADNLTGDGVVKTEVKEGGEDGGAGSDVAGALCGVAGATGEGSELS